MLAVIDLNDTGGHSDYHWYLGQMDKMKEAVTKHIIIHFFSMCWFD